MKNLPGLICLIGILINPSPLRGEGEGEGERNVFATLPSVPSFRTRALSFDPDGGLRTRTPEGQDESHRGRGFFK